MTSLLINTNVSFSPDNRLKGLLKGLQLSVINTRKEIPLKNQAFSVSH